MDWLQSVANWIVEHWRAIGFVGSLGLAGKVIHWWWNVRKARAEALKAEDDLRQTIMAREMAKARAERIKAYIQFFEDDWATTPKGPGTIWYTGAPKPAPDEDADEVREAWETFCKRHGR